MHLDIHCNKFITLYDLATRLLRRLSLNIRLKKEKHADRRLGHLWYDDDDWSIHCTAISIAEWAKNERTDLMTADHYRECMKLAHKAIEWTDDDDLLYALFAILHEIGHWHQQMDNPTSFKEQATEEKREIAAMNCRAQDMANRGVARDIIISDYARAYRQIAFEQSADIYAIEALPKLLSEE